MKTARTLGLITALVTAAVSFESLAQQPSPNGTWLRSNGAQISVFDCNGGLGMKVVKSPDADKVGKTIMCGAKRTAGNKWQGDLLNLDDGQTYTGNVTLIGERLTLSGCALGGTFCKDDTWTRVK